LRDLRKLDISDCKLDFNGFYTLCFNIKGNKKLDVLIVNKNNLSSNKFREIRNFLNLMSIKQLHMANCFIGNEGVFSLAEGLSYNTSLKILDISNNKFDDKGFQYFKEFPIKNTTLESLDISKNLVTDISAKDFVLNLTRNPTMKNLCFFDNEMKNETGNAFIEVLRFNRNIIKLNLRFNRIQMRIIEEIKRLLKVNKENYKNKYIPNLKREIRQQFILPTDFEITDLKIQETSSNVKSVNFTIKNSSKKNSAKKC
jgi:Ran GTPase-activating protein (RanGAP) involved in mRNA processing and transport